MNIIASYAAAVRVIATFYPLTSLASEGIGSRDDPNDGCVGDKNIMA